MPRGGPRGGRPAAEVVERFRAYLRFRSSEEGGRRTPIFSGYRPMLNFEPRQADRFNDGQVTLEGRDTCAPGEECTAEIRLAAPECVPVEVKPGIRFLLNEGGRVVAEGEVIAVL